MSGGPGASGRAGFVGCLGKCTSGLGAEELDLVTDDIQRTLEHPAGRRILRSFLLQGRRRTQLGCLDLYERCCECLDKDLHARLSQKEPSVEPLEQDVAGLLGTIKDLDDVPQLDMALLKRYRAAQESHSRDMLLEAVEVTKERLTEYLGKVHKSFRTYVQQPCPRTNK